MPNPDDGFIVFGSACDPVDFRAVPWAGMAAMKQMAEDRERANARARDLLSANLDEAQRRSLKKERRFIVRGGKSGLPYLIREDGYVFLQSERDPGRTIGGFCVHPARESRGHFGGLLPLEDLPLADRVLTMALYIQHAEPHFLRVAVYSGDREPLQHHFPSYRR